MAKRAELVNVEDLKVGDVISSYATTINGPLHRKVVMIRHTPGSIRYTLNLDDNDYLNLDEGSTVYIIIEED